MAIARVFCRTVIAVRGTREEGLEYGAGDEVLGEHLDDLGLGDGGVEIVAQFRHEGTEGASFLFVGGALDDGLDAGDVGARDAGDVAGPVFPVGAADAFFHDPGVEGALEFAGGEFDLGLDGGIGGAGRDADGLAGEPFPEVLSLFFGAADGLVGDGDDLHLVGRRAGEIELVDHGVEAVVVGAERLEHLPDDLVDLVVGEGLVGFHASGDDHGEDDIAPGLARGAAHDASDGLDDFHRGVARAEEEDGVEGGDIDALGEATDIAEDAAGVVGGAARSQASLASFWLAFMAPSTCSAWQSRTPASLSCSL